MPRSYRRGKRTRGRRYQRRRKGKTSKINILVNTGPTFFPDVYRTKLKFSFQEDLSTSAASWFRKRFVVANGLILPANDSGSIDAPNGSAELFQIYSRYVVRASSIDFRYSSSNTAVGTNICIIPETSSGALRVTSAMGEPYAKMKMLGTSFGKNEIRIQSYMTTKSIFGSMFAKTGNDWAGNSVSNPGQQWFWNIILETASGNAPTEDIDGSYICTMTYYVDFFEREQLDIS